MHSAISHDLQTYGSTSQPGLFLSLPLTCFRVSSHSLQPHRALSVCPSEGSLIRFRGQSLLLSWPSGFMEWESRDTIRHDRWGIQSLPWTWQMFKSDSSSWGTFLDLLMAYCWTFLTTILLIWQGISISWPSQMPSFCVQWSTPQLLLAEIPPYIWKTLFGQSLLNEPRPTFWWWTWIHPSPWDLGIFTLLLKGTALLSKAASVLSPRAASDRSVSWYSQAWSRHQSTVPKCRKESSLSWDLEVRKYSPPMHPYPYRWGKYQVFTKKFS